MPPDVSCNPVRRPAKPDGLPCSDRHSPGKQKTPLGNHPEAEGGPGSHDPVASSPTRFARFPAAPRRTRAFVWEFYELICQSNECVVPPVHTPVSVPAKPGSKRYSGDLEGRFLVSELGLPGRFLMEPATCGTPQRIDFRFNVPAGQRKRPFSRPTPPQNPLPRGQ